MSTGKKSTATISIYGSMSGINTVSTIYSDCRVFLFVMTFLIGTCVSTLETHCYDEYYPQQEVVDYFDKAVEVFERVPSYKVCDLLHLYWNKH